MTKRFLLAMTFAFAGCASKGAGITAEAPMTCPSPEAIAGLYDAPAPAYDADRGTCLVAAKEFQRSAHATTFRLTHASETDADANAFVLTVDGDPDAEPATWTLDRTTCELVHADADGRDVLVTRATPTGRALALDYRFAPADGACTVSSRIVAVKR